MSAALPMAGAASEFAPDPRPPSQSIPPIRCSSGDGLEQPSMTGTRLLTIPVATRKILPLIAGQHGIFGRFYSSNGDGVTVGNNKIDFLQRFVFI